MTVKQQIGPLSCTTCQCEIYLFPTGRGWDDIAQAYSHAGFLVPYPVCGDQSHPASTVFSEQERDE